MLFRCGYRSFDDVDDISQETFVALLEKDGRLVRSWDPDRASFETYSGHIAAQRAIDYVRRRRELLFDDDAPPESMELAIDSSRNPDRLAASRELQEKTLARLWDELHEQGRRMFELIIVEEREVDDICTQTNMERSAVYAWRSRLKRRIQEIAAAIGDEK